MSVFETFGFMQAILNEDLVQMIKREEETS